MRLHHRKKKTNKQKNLFQHWGYSLPFFLQQRNAFLVYVPIVIPNFHVESESLKTQLFQTKEKIISGLYLWSHIKRSSHSSGRRKEWEMRNTTKRHLFWLSDNWYRYNIINYLIHEMAMDFDPCIISGPASKVFHCLFLSPSLRKAALHCMTLLWNELKKTFL